VGLYDTEEEGDQEEEKIIFYQGAGKETEADDM